MTANSRTDQNQVEIMGVYRSLGCSVVDCHNVRGGFPDLVIGFKTGFGGVTELVEIKYESGGKTPAQKTFEATWRGSKTVTVRTVEDAIDHFQSVQKKYGIRR